MTQQPSFFDRTTFGLPNYFLIALVAAMLIAMVPRAAQKALRSNTNKAEDWLPANYTESADLRWFRTHFISEGFILVTWDGCTLGNQQQLNDLRERLSARLQEVEPGEEDTFGHPLEQRTGKWFRKILTGPSMIEQLTSPPLSLSYAEAVRRLEGALVGPPQRDAQGNSLGDDSRTTCLVTYLTPEGYETNRAMRRTVDFVEQVAVEEIGIPRDELHMGGPTVDNVAIDRAGEGTLARLAGLSGIVGLTISYWCFRNLKLTTVVVAVGSISACTSLALVFYFGVIEVVLLGHPETTYGKMDAVMMSMPAVVYILGLSGAIHLVNYYRDTRVSRGLYGAAERAVRLASSPCILAALTTAVGLGSLVVSDIVPIKKFGGFTAAAVIATLGILFTVLPVYLHRFPPKKIGRRPWNEMSDDAPTLPRWAARFSQFIANRYALVISVCLVVMVFMGIGLTRIQSTVQLLRLLDAESDIVQDYTWIERNMGNLVPMEVLITVPPELTRAGDQHAEADGQQYRMTMLERLHMIERMIARIESLDAVSRTLSVSTFAPSETTSTSDTLRRGTEFTTNRSLEQSRDFYSDYLQRELEDGQVTPHSRELWRISARVTALEDIDYGRFTEQLRQEVEPVLTTYRRRDLLVKDLHERDRRLEGARLVVLFDGKQTDGQPADGSSEAMFADLLQESGVRARVDGQRGNVALFNIAVLDDPQLDAPGREQVIETLQKQDGVLLVSDELRDSAQQLADLGVPVIDVTHPVEPEHSAAIPSNVELGPRTLRSVYTGIIPLVFKTQRQLMVSLRESMTLATLLIAGVMAIVFRHAVAGIAAVVPNVFPIFLVFGALGWLGIKVDIGIMMTASVALGVAVDNTVHLVTWFRDAQRRGMNRRDAVLTAYERCATAMVQTALVGGLGLVVFAFSSFTPTQQFGYLMITILCAALVGDLVFLPAMLCSPIGRFFESKRPETPPEPSAASQASLPAADRRDDLEAEGAALATPPAEPRDADRDDRAAQPPHDDEELASPANAALRARLRAFRRSPAPNDRFGPR